MTVGTKSLLWGVHQFLLHPLFVLVAWRKLYGSFPRDPRIWLAILIHDWGYWGCPEMDGPRGSEHPYWAANVMCGWFDQYDQDGVGWYWHDFMLFHSRHLAARFGQPPSQLCYPDKLALTLYPGWLFSLLGRLSGEIWEYIEDSQKTTTERPGHYTAWEEKLIRSGHPGAWHQAIKAFMKRWLEENLPSERKAA